MRRAAIILGLLFTLLPGSSAAADGFRVIVNPDNPITAIGRETLRDAYLKKATEWGNGVTIRPLGLVEKFPERDQFTREVIHKTPAQLRSYWLQRIFSGKGTPPADVDSVEEMIARVLAQPGAVGYLPAGADPGGAKVIAVQ